MIKKGLLKMQNFKPKAVVIDPLTSLIGEGDQREIRSMITRMIDLLKSNGITSFFTSLVSSAALREAAERIQYFPLYSNQIVA